MNAKQLIDACIAYEMNGNNPPDGRRCVRDARQNLQAAIQRAKPKTIGVGQRREPTREQREAIGAALRRAEDALDDWAAPPLRPH